MGPYSEMVYTGYDLRLCHTAATQLRGTAMKQGNRYGRIW